MTGHQKRLSAPESWPVERKTATWTVKASAGPHGESGVPLLIVLRDVLGYVDSRKEANYALNQNGILVNGDVPSSVERPIGMFDILAFPGREEYYRVFPDEGGRLSLTSIDADAADSRLGKIIRKTQVTGGDIQLTLHDGANIRVDADTDYATGDSLVIDNETKDIVAHFVYEEGALVTAVAGSHAGEIGEIEEITITPGSGDNVVSIGQNGIEFETVEEYVVVIDDDFDNKNDKGNNGNMVNNPNGGGSNPSPEEIISRIERGESEDPELDYYNALEEYQSRSLEPEDVVQLYRLRSAIKDRFEPADLDELLDEYFADLIESGRKKELQMGVEEPRSPDEIAEELEILEEEWEERLGDSYDPLDDGLKNAKRNYLLSVRDSLE